MGMRLGLTTLSDGNIERVLRDPPLVWRVVAPDDPEMYEDARAAQQQPLLISKLMGRGMHSSDEPQLELSKGEGTSTDLDKAWHGIHYLLTGSADGGQSPRDFLLSGGTEIGDIDVGYGPARALTASKARAARDELQALSDEQLKARYRPKDMLALKIYPEIWGRDPANDDMLGYLLEHVQALRTFLERAVDGGFGVIVYLS